MDERDTGAGMCKRAATADRSAAAVVFSVCDDEGMEFLKQGRAAWQMVMEEILRVRVSDACIQDAQA